MAARRRPEEVEGSAASRRGTGNGIHEISCVGVRGKGGTDGGSAL